MTRSEEKLLVDRIAWLKQKLAMMRDPDNFEYTANRQLWGRCEGNIGGLTWALREMKKLKTED